jgi:hypothetical protein
MAVAVLFGKRESGEKVDCVVSSIHQAGRLYAQLLTYRRGAANRRFGPILLKKSVYRLNQIFSAP